jgi:hypothetical protein
MDVWLHHSKVSEEKVFRRVLKNGARQDGGVTPHDLRRYAACGINAAPAPGYAIWQAESLSRFNFCLDTHPSRQPSGISAASRDSAMR